MSVKEPAKPAGAPKEASRRERAKRKKSTTKLHSRNRSRSKINSFFMVSEGNT
jgi:hypothetical protein